MTAFESLVCAAETRLPPRARRRARTSGWRGAFARRAGAVELGLRTGTPSTIDSLRRSSSKRLLERRLVLLDRRPRQRKPGQGLLKRDPELLRIEPGQDLACLHGTSFSSTITSAIRPEISAPTVTSLFGSRLPVAVAVRTMSPRSTVWVCQRTVSSPGHSHQARSAAAATAAASQVAYPRRPRACSLRITARTWRAISSSAGSSLLSMGGVAKE
jgi:hypothetical protein